MRKRRIIARYNRWSRFLRISLIVGVTVLGAGLAYWLFALPSVAELSIDHSQESIKRGGYLVAAGGCVSCHEGTQDAESMSGGLALVSEFGTFYAPNITPDEATGIGDWQAQDFVLALKHGRSPDGSFYYPAFPYPAYAGMTDQDALDIAAYLMSLPPVPSTVPEHELAVGLWRWTISGWNALATLLQPTRPPQTDPVAARGAYLARHLGHCGECHTPRNALGMTDLNREYEGAELLNTDLDKDSQGHGHATVEAIDRSALADWSQDDFVLFLSLGLKPDGEFVGGEMEKVIQHNTSKLTQEDKQALAAHFIGS